MSIGAGVISIGFILYRLFGSIFGLTLTGDAISELSLPIGVALVAGAVAGYHGSQLRRDQSLRTGREPSPSEPAAAPSRIWLRLTGPPGADVDSLLVELRHQVPAGYALEVVEAPGSPAAAANPITEPAQYS